MALGIIGTTVIDYDLIHHISICPPDVKYVNSIQPVVCVKVVYKDNDKPEIIPIYSEEAFQLFIESLQLHLCMTIPSTIILNEVKPNSK